MQTVIFEETGQLIIDPKRVLQEQRRFYQKLYTSDTKVKCHFEFEIEKVISEQTKMEFEMPLTIEEIGKALMTTKNDRSPGASGFPADFLKVFWLKLKHNIIDLFNHIFEVASIHISGRYGVISLIPKKTRDPKWLKNWHPICLLDSVYKLLSKTIANRLKSVLQQIIHPDQGGFVPGRHISENLRKIIDTISLAEHHKIEGLLLQIDFMKAFDRVEYPSLIYILRKFNFGEKFLKWVQILFTDMKLCTQNNGYNSEYFVPTRGLFQGNPISSFGFTCVVEILAILLRKNEKIKGIKIGAFQSMLSLFADDLTIMIENDQKSWNQIRQTLEYFHTISGLKVNYEKLTFYRFGLAKKSNSKYFSLNKLRWTDKVDILGVIIPENLSKLREENITPTIEKANAILNLWKQRNLSLIGKITIVNTLISSLFVYRLTILPILNKDVIEDYEKTVTRFIWNKGKSKVPLSLLMSNKEDEGLGLTNLTLKDIALKAQWVKKTKENEELWLRVKLSLDLRIDRWIWETNLNRKDTLEIFTPSFWTDVLIAWNQLTNNKISTQKDVLNQVIWYNSHIKIDNKCIILAQWIRYGIIYIEDLLNEQHRLLSPVQLQEKFGLQVYFTDLYGIWEAIPKRWKRMLHQKDESNPSFHQWQKIEGLAKPTSFIYKSLNCNESILVPIVRKWEKLEIEVSIEQVKQAIRNMYHITISSQLRSFQYRILTCSLITNIQLFHYKIQQ